VELSALAHSQVKRASELSPEVAGHGDDRMLPVAPALRDLFPGGGLRRGATIAIAPGASPGATSLMLATLAAAAQAGSWVAIVGVPGLGPLAAHELGIALDRMALVPRPGVSFDRVVATLLDGFDIVVAAPAGAVPLASVRTQLASRARQHGSVLVPFGPLAWDGADITLRTEGSVWHGLERGRGRLRARSLTVVARGKGASARPRHATLWLPHHPDIAEIAEPSAAARPRLSVVRGRAEH
jgi:hypothetical protein